eukprot:gene29478-33128_t
MFGPSMFIFATLKIGTLTEEQRADFMRKLELIPEILESYSIFGERDMLIKVLAPSMDWYQNFVFKTVLKLPGVIDIQSTVTLSEMKFTTAIPVRGNRALLAIRVPDNGHSLSTIVPVFPSPCGHLGKEQSGTDFGKRGYFGWLSARSPELLSRWGFPFGNSMPIKRARLLKR